jgi:hypothetical protein
MPCMSSGGESFVPRRNLILASSYGGYAVKKARNCGWGRSSDKLPARQSGNRPDPDGEYFFSKTACAIRLL